MRAKSAILLILALGCGLIAAIGVTQVINKDKTEVQQSDTQAIIVATTDISPNTLITPEMVKLEPWPKEKVPKDAISQVEKLENCRARSEIFQGEPVVERKLLGKDLTRKTAADLIPKGYRVVGVKVDMVSGAGLIQPGDRVDVLLNLFRNPKKGILENRTKTVLQDIKVFAVEDKFKLDLTEDEEDSTHAKVIQLLVTPPQAEKLVLAQQLGKVQLTMRPPGGEGIVQTPGTTPSELFSGTNIGNRKQEDPIVKQPGPDGASGILDILNGMKKGSPQTTDAQLGQPDGSKTWKMRIIAGPQMTDIMMKESVDPTSGEHFWQIGPPEGMLEPVQPPVANPPTPDANTPQEPPSDVPTNEPIE